MDYFPGLKILTFGRATLLYGFPRGRGKNHSLIKEARMELFSNHEQAAPGSGNSCDAAEAHMGGGEVVPSISSTGPTL